MGIDSAIARLARQAIDAVSPLRKMVKSSLGQRLINTVRGARTLREPIRFAALQLGPPRTASYRVRESGLRISLRHGTRDVDVLNELFGGTGGRLIYDPPAAVKSMLDANQAPKVLDLGANIGLFGIYVLGRWPGASIRSFEPDPNNMALVNRAITANGLDQHWSVAEVAVGNRDAESRFTAGLFADSHLSFETGTTSQAPEPGGHTITVRTVDIFAQDHDVDLMKMDIEGGEWAILGDPRLASLGANVVVFEWHTGGCPEPDPPAYAIRLLRAAGYGGVEEIVDGGEAGTIWAWRETDNGISARAS